MWAVPTITIRFPSNVPNMIGHHVTSAMAMATPIAHKGAVAGAKAERPQAPAAPSIETPLRARSPPCRRCARRLDRQGGGRLCLTFDPRE